MKIKNHPSLPMHLLEEESALDCDINIDLHREMNRRQVLSYLTMHRSHHQTTLDFTTTLTKEHITPPCEPRLTWRSRWKSHPGLKTGTYSKKKVTRMLEYPKNFFFPNLQSDNCFFMFNIYPGALLKNHTL